MGPSPPEISAGAAEFARKVSRLNEIGIALSTEKDSDRLLETILLGAKELCNADAGTLYSMTEERTLKFSIIRTDSLHIAMGGTTGVAIPFPPLRLYRDDGEPNLQHIAAFVALKEQTINIPDAYTAEGFDFSGTRAFDKNTGYRSTSFLTVPLKSHENEIIGVLQLINAKDWDTGRIRTFSQEDQKLAESLASQAAIALTNKRLIEDLRHLFEAFIKAIASAIDEKSPYTGGHCERVPVMAELLAKAANECDHGELKEFRLTDEEMYELRIASWLHDCGKVVTPTEVVDKGTKLETIFDRIHLVDTRFESLMRQTEVAFLKEKLSALEQGTPERIPELERNFQETIARYEEDRAFVKESNIGGEFMSPERQQRIRDIGAYTWTNPDGEVVTFLTENEVYNLNIARGTITPEEREIINNHVSASIKMLEALPFPKNLKNVPAIAGAHHENMIGTGYPKKLKRDQMSVQARILAIADVFEALTACDRPYKKGKTLSESLKILGFMKKDQHIDPDLFQVLIDYKVYLAYAEQYLGAEQIDAVDHSKIPGYVSASPTTP
ncbi:MAG: GAF domain-containing protein [Magnetococcales bacterium]|nr:GAF domain-containing protein [Magnetococcales bacterium]MBF0155973.1 GAF domain-containing protein [Magnetococcales bacterium]